MREAPILGWSIRVGRQREELLQQFPPRYAEVVADHITFKGGKELPDAAEAEIVGRADDGEGVECLVVRIGGTTHRPDGSTWHITWSLGPGRRAKESNDVLRAQGWEEIELPVPVRLRPARWP